MPSHALRCQHPRGEKPQRQGCDPFQSPLRQHHQLEPLPRTHKASPLPRLSFARTAWPRIDSGNGSQPQQLRCLLRPPLPLPLTLWREKE